MLAEPSMRTQQTRLILRGAFASRHSWSECAGCVAALTLHSRNSDAVLFFESYPLQTKQFLRCRSKRVRLDLTFYSIIQNTCCRSRGGLRAHLLYAARHAVRQPKWLRRRRHFPLLQLPPLRRTKQVAQHGLCCSVSASAPKAPTR